MDRNGSISLGDFAHRLAAQWLDVRLEYAEVTGKSLTLWDIDMHDMMDTIDRVSRTCGLTFSASDLCVLTELVETEVRARFSAIRGAVRLAS